MSKLEELECNCIDTATPDTETTFECDGGCDSVITWRTTLDGVVHWKGGHWHTDCLLEKFLKENT